MIVATTVLMSAIFWLSYLYFPAAFLLTRHILRRQKYRIVSVLALIPLTLLAYARFVEPRRLLVADYDIELCGDGLPGTLRAAVAADFHIGIFKNATSMRRVVNQVNASDADLLLMPGDFTLYLDPKNYDRAFAPLADLRMPAYAVMGNHDVGIPGPDHRVELTAALERYGVIVIEAKEAIYSGKGKYLRIIGFRDYWDATYRDKSLGNMPDRLDMATIFLQHNPDMIKDPRVGNFDLMVSGHTHGGQINLPFLTCALTFACDTLRYGYEDTPTGQLFVTSGTGMTGLPMRFGVPPRIDILNLTISRCRVQYNRSLLVPKSRRYKEKTPPDRPKRRGRS